MQMVTVFTITYTYDTARRLTREQVAGSGAGTVDRAFTFDSRGNRTRMTVSGSANYTVNYTYDLNNRLLTEVRTGDGARSSTFTYDRNGNQISKTTIDHSIVVAPGAPRNLAAHRDIRSVTITWSPPESDGGAAITGYQVSSNNGVTWVATSSSSSHTFSNLPAVAHTFKVRAVNDAGTGEAASVVATPYAPAVPGSPRIVTVRSEVGSVTIVWAPPENDGGSPITGYEVSSNNGVTWVTAQGGSHTFFKFIAGNAHIYGACG